MVVTHRLVAQIPIRFEFTVVVPKTSLPTFERFVRTLESVWHRTTNVNTMPTCFVTTGDVYAGGPVRLAGLHVQGEVYQGDNDYVDIEQMVAELFAELAGIFREGNTHFWFNYQRRELVRS